MGQHTQFEYITQQQLDALVEFSLTKDIYAQAAWQLWSHSASIPMGGPFSAQGADLHWQAKKKCHFLRRLGTLRISDTQHPLWDTPRGNTVSLAQFRDNILTAATGPTCKSERAHVCLAPTQAWGLPVICPCITPTQGLWRERVQGKGSEWRSASRRRQLQTRSSHHGVMPKPRPNPHTHKLACPPPPQQWASI